ncbi:MULTISPECIES: OmpA family protein [unclassified Pseudomonas]|uniref:OmpA family protein n=1 Tax=unclassified Pseudomonas TaxID=196821 RepID=UPI000537DC3B|nr:MULTISPECIES: OmpA family protein [unclassified Pseudomonas]MBD0683035.1 OmpA family protein [Pseudomonas sp. PSB18]CDF92585.1 Outer membrane lipoprotein omp16 precursor [Pseudomonas sp. SHC52]
MRISLLVPMVSLFGLTLVGCAATPENANLLAARSQFSALQSNPAASTLAAIETKDAFTALSKADMLSNQDRKAPGVDQLAYIAQQKIALAEQTIQGRQAEAGLSNIAVERTQVQLDVRTQQLKALQAINAKSTDRGQVVTFGDVLFDTGKAELKYNSDSNLRQLADFLKANPERKLRVEGFTDSVGNDTFNQRLSERRADSVAFALTRLGVDPSRITTAGYGREYPVADNATARSRQLNRRVEVIISNGSSAVQSRG